LPEVPGDFVRPSSRYVWQTQAVWYLAHRPGKFSVDLGGILDFKNIEYIGQAFADEIFRVFPTQKNLTYFFGNFPEIRYIYIVP